MSTISSPYRTQKLADSDRRVRHPLQRLRGTIRFYAVAEAVSVLIVSLAIWFWVGLALDYGTFRLVGLDWIEYTPLWLRAMGLGAVLLGIVGFVELGLHRKVFRRPKETVESVSGMPTIPGLLPTMMVTNYMPERRRGKKQPSIMFGILGVFVWLGSGFTYFVMLALLQSFPLAIPMLIALATLATSFYAAIRFLLRNESKFTEVLLDLAYGFVLFFTPLLALLILPGNLFPLVLILGFTAGTLRVAFNLRWWAVGLVMLVLGIYFGLWGGFGALLSSLSPRWFVAGGLVVLILGGLAAFMVLKRLFYDFSDPALALVLERKFPNLLGDRLITAVELADVRTAAKLGYSSEMIEETINEAADRVDKVPLKEVFNWGPLLLRTVLAVLLVLGLYGIVGTGFCTIGAVTGKSPVSMAGLSQLHDVSGLWAERNLMLENSSWPRRSYLEVINWPDNPERELRIGQQAAAPSVRVRALKWVWADNRDSWRALLWSDLANPKLVGNSIALPKAMLDQKPEWTVDQVEMQLGRFDPANRTQGPDMQPYLDVKQVLDKLDLFTKIPAVTVRKQQALEEGAKEGWVIRDGETHRPLTWADLKQLAPQVQGDVKVTVADLPKGWPTKVDDVLKKLGDAAGVDDLDFFQRATEAIARLNEIVASGEMKRELRKLIIPDRVVVNTQGTTTRVEILLEKQGDNEYTGTFSDLKESIKFQAVGEDYYTPWYRIELVPPPAVTELLVDEWRPAYLYYRIPENKTADDLKGHKQVFRNRQISVSGGDTSRFELPVGSDVTLKGTMDKPLKLPSSANGQEAGIRLLPPRKGTTEVKAELSQPDGKTWHVGIKNIRTVQDFVLEFKDPDNVVSLRHIIVRPVDDLPPDVDTVVDPVIRKNNQGYLVTAKAFIPFVGKIRDDNGLEKVNFSYTLTRLEGAAEGGARALVVLSALYQSAGPLGSQLTSSLQLAAGAKLSKPDAPDDKATQRQPMFGYDLRFNDRGERQFFNYDQLRQLLTLDGNQKLTKPWPDVMHPASAAGRLFREFQLDPKMDPTDDPKFINNHDGFDLDPFKLAVDAKEIQPRYRLQLWLEVEDNAIDTQPHKSVSKEKFIFQVVGESDLMSEVGKEEESLQIRMEELIRKLEESRTRLDKLKIDLGPVGSRDLKDEEFLGLDERLRASEEAMEKSLDMSVNLVTDYQRIVRELRVNRTNPVKIDTVGKTIVTPLEMMLKSDWEMKDPNDPAKPAGDPELEPQQGHFAWALDGLHKGRETMTPLLTRLQEMRPVENRPKFSDDSRDRFTKARDRMDRLILRLRGVLNAMEGITTQNRAIEQLRKIKGEAELQGDLLQQAFEEEQKRLLKELNLFGEPPPKKP